MKLTKVGILSFAKLQGIFGIFVGVFVGIFFSFFLFLLAGIVASSMGFDKVPLVSKLLISFVLIISFPLFYGVIGFIGGAFGAWMYNFASKRVGGLEVEFER